MLIEYVLMIKKIYRLIYMFSLRECWEAQAPTQHQESSWRMLGIAVKKPQINLSYKKTIILDGSSAPRLSTHEYGLMRKPPSFLETIAKSFLPPI